jgi:Right handed beta helix region
MKNGKPMLRATRVVRSRFAYGRKSPRLLPPFRRNKRPPVPYAKRPCERKMLDGAILRLAPTHRRVIMRKLAFMFATLGVALGLAGAPPCRAAGTNGHSFVSANGDDSNPCTFASPCANLQAAVDATLAGGEVSCLDAGGNLDTGGTFTATKNITIDCTGTSSLFVGAITVNGANVVVTLRNLHLVDFEVDFNKGAALFIENCVFDYSHSNLQPVGIDFAPSSGAAKLYVTDSIFKNIGTGSSAGGIVIEPAAAAEADVTIERTKVENNRAGIVAISQGTVHGAVRDSVVSGSTASWGIGVSGPGVSFLVENTTVTDNNVGLVAENKAGMLVSHSSIVLNTNGLYAASGGSLLSYKNNNLNRNIHSDGVFTTTLAQQ